MAVLVLEHDPLDTSDRLGQTLRDHGHRLRTIRLHAGDSLPTDLDDVDGIVTLGGVMDVDQTDKHGWIEPELALIKQAHEDGLPVVGECLGAQLVATALGGEVTKEGEFEAGFGKVEQSFFGTIDPLFAGIPWKFPVFHSHGCHIAKPPPGGPPMALASSPLCKVQAFKVGMKTYGFQFHFNLSVANFMPFVESARAWAEQNGCDVDALLASREEHFDLYRHLNDRLCRNIATLLFPIDKRATA